MLDPVINIGSRRELFFDQFLLQNRYGIFFKLHRPERREVSLQMEMPWEDNIASFNSVVQDGAVVRLYYRASIPDRKNEDLQAVALAESYDGGITFQRPVLGLVAFNGSRQNNLLYLGEPPGVPPAFLDTNPACDAAQRYKGLSSRWKALYASSSPDGIHWQPMQDEPLQMTGTFDTINTAFWDRITGCYRCYTRYFINLQEDSDEADVLGPKPTVVRAIQSATSTDFIHWSEPLPNVYNDPYQDMQLYTNAVVPCPGAEHIYLSFPNRYVQERVKYPQHPYPGVNDALFMASRDGVHWNRFAEAWMRPGLDERNWTERNNYPAWGIVQTSPREWSMYISEHYRQPDGVLPRLRRLAIRPHGFVSLHANYNGGDVITKPLLFDGKELRLNYSTSAAGYLQVGVLDHEGVALPGLSQDDMEPLFGDALDEVIRWKGGSDLSTLAGKPIRLHFNLRDADLFAMRFSP